MYLVKKEYFGNQVNFSVVDHEGNVIFRSASGPVAKTLANDLNEQNHDS